FCKLHGFAAHARRRNGTVSACGVRIEDIRQHLWKTVDGLQSISKSKVYNLRQPRRSNTKEASNHKNGVDVSVGKKNTDISNDHQDVHAYFSSVKYVRELDAKYSEHFSVWSRDAGLPGERKPQVYQTDLSEDDRIQKKYKVLDSAVKDLNSYWNERTHDDFNICSVGVGCDGSLLSSHAEWNYTSYYQDYEKAIPKSVKWLLPPVTRDVMNDGHHLSSTHEAPTDTISDPDELLGVATFGYCENQCRYVLTPVADGVKHEMFIHDSKTQKKPKLQDRILVVFVMRCFLPDTSY
ncbi:Hypothetical predicted protein, partial [Mytilus galloprovincialis]